MKKKTRKKKPNSNTSLGRTNISKSADVLFEKFQTYTRNVLILVLFKFFTNMYHPIKQK